MSEEPVGDAAEMADGVEAPYLSADDSRHGWLSTLKVTATRRALLLTALGGLLIAGLITALPLGRQNSGLAAYLEPEASTSRGGETFREAVAGSCLTWPEGKTPDEASVVDCAADHRFEVAEPIDMSDFPGTEYGPQAEPPSPARIQQISQEQCQAAVQRYLGPKFDPNSRFTVSMLWAGDKAWKQSGERRLLCGLQLPGPDNQQLAYQGKVAEVDQSKVWPAGTCLGVDTASNQPNDVAVDCSVPHAMEVTGSVNLAEKFPGGLPAEPDQDAFIKDTCNRLTDQYLAPIQLRTTTLTLVYNTVALPSWSAGSRQVACSIGATLGNGGWATLINSAKGPILINGQPPVPPPDIPTERLNLPPSLYEPAPNSSDSGSSSSSSGGGYSSGSSSGSSGSSTGSSSGSSSQPEGNQHMPGQPAAQAPAPAAPGPASDAPAPPPSGNVFNPPVYAPPPPDAGVPVPPNLGAPPGPVDVPPA